MKRTVSKRGTRKEAMFFSDRDNLDSSSRSFAVKSNVSGAGIIYLNPLVAQVERPTARPRELLLLRGTRQRHLLLAASPSRPSAHEIRMIISNRRTISMICYGFAKIWSSRDTLHTPILFPSFPIPNPYSPSPTHSVSFPFPFFLPSLSSFPPSPLSLPLLFPLPRPQSPNMHFTSKLFSFFSHIQYRQSFSPILHSAIPFLSRFSQSNFSNITLFPPSSPFPPHSLTPLNLPFSLLPSPSLSLSTTPVLFPSIHHSLLLHLFIVELLPLHPLLWSHRLFEMGYKSICLWTSKNQHHK